MSTAQTPVLQGFRGLLMSRRVMLALIALVPVALYARAAASDSSDAEEVPPRHRDCSAAGES